MKKNNPVFTAPLYVTVIMILLGFSDKLLEMSLKKSTDDFFFTAVLLQLFVYMIPAALYCKIKKTDMIKASGAKLLSISDIPFVISAFVLYMLGILFLIYIGMTPGNQAESFSSIQVNFSTDSFTVSLCYIVIPAVAEEMLFRSVLISEYSSAHSSGICTLLITSVFFAMIHFSFPAFISYLWGGAIFGLITYITHSSLPSVLLHMLSNYITVSYSDKIAQFLESAENSIVLIFLMSVLFLLSLYFTLATLQSIYEKRAAEYEDGTLAGSRADAIKRLTKAGKVNKSETENTKTARASAKDIFLSPAFFLAVFVFVFITV